MMTIKVLVALTVVSCSVLCANSTFLSKQNEVEPKPDIFGSLLSLKKNLFGGLKGGKGDLGGGSAGGEASGYGYAPPVPKPVYGPPQVHPAPPPKPVYGPPHVHPPSPPQIQPAPRPIYGPPQVQHQHAAPIGISQSGSSAAAASSGGHGNLFKSIG
jgi:hypothetical protein